MTIKKFAAYAIPVVVALTIGVLGSYIQGDALREWYPYIYKSPLTPPARLFPIVWSALYILMGISLGTMLVRRDVSVLKLWIAQLLVNFLWSVCFFALRSPMLGLIAILILDVLVFAYLVSTITRRPLAGWLFVPYLLWLLYATYLNGYVYFYNH